MIRGPGRDGLSSISFKGGSICETENLETDSLKTSHTCIVRGKASFVYPQGYVHPSVETPGPVDYGTEIKRVCSTDRTGFQSLALYLGKTPISAPQFPRGSNELCS